MSDSPKAVARAFVAAINRQDVEGLAALMTPEHRFTDSLGNVVEGREKMRAGWVAYFRMVPDYSIAVEESFCDGPVVVMLGMVQGTYTHPSDEDLSPHPNEQRSLAGGPESPGTPGYATGGELKAENRWETPAALGAVIENDLVAEWRVYADNEPIRQRMRQP
jgi:limonene-1,2-epoxide hydrolase